MGRTFQGQLEAAPKLPDFYHGLRGADDIDMSLLVRASRDLPISLMAKEYEGILRRRLAAVGGSQNDPALKQIIANFKAETLPESAKRGGAVRKGTVISFSKVRYTCFSSCL